jgi:seryl-tRNA synthetase
MLDIKFIRDNPDKVKAAALLKNISIDLDALLRLDDKILSLQKDYDDLRNKQNQHKKKPTPSELKDLKQTSESLKTAESKIRDLKLKFDKLMLEVPNIPSPDVPVGKSDKNNIVKRIWGNPIRFDFKPKSHIDLATSLNIVDFDRGVKIAGFRNYFLKNEGVVLDMAISRYALDFMQARGFELMAPPIIADERYFVGSGHLPWFADEIYRISDTKNNTQNLIGTSEVPLVGYHAGEILDHTDLPKRYAGISQCFRTEIGSYGQDSKGLFRVHQFNKVEQVMLCEADPTVSKRWLQELLGIAESFVSSLGLPYRIMQMCTGDMGASKVEMYDIETWMPSYAHYRETHSASNLGDFQSRRLNIRYRDKDGRLQYPHTLNNTVVATPRMLIPILENFQRKDGSVVIPDVLKPYTNFKVIEPKKKID